MKPGLKVGDRVKVGLRVGEITRLDGRHVVVWFRDGSMPHRVPVSHCIPVEVAR